MLWRLWEAGLSWRSAAWTAQAPSGLSQDRGGGSHWLFPARLVVFAVCMASDELKHPLPFPGLYPKPELPECCSGIGEEEGCARGLPLLQESRDGGCSCQSLGFGV